MVIPLTRCCMGGTLSKLSSLNLSNSNNNPAKYAEVSAMNAIEDKKEENAYLSDSTPQKKNYWKKFVGFLRCLSFSLILPQHSVCWVAYYQTVCWNSDNIWEFSIVNQLSRNDVMHISIKLCLHANEHVVVIYLTLYSSTIIFPYLWQLGCTVYLYLWFMFFYVNIAK